VPVTTVYIDTLFLINFIINDLLLLAAAKITGTRIFRLRIAGGAAFGGLYAVAAVFPQFGFLTAVPFKITAALLMALIAYGLKPACGFIRLLLVFMGISMALGGGVMIVALLLSGTGAVSNVLQGGGYYYPVSARALILTSAACYALITLVFRASARRIGRTSTAKIVARFENLQVRFEALVDTGNALTDPVTNAMVIVAQREAIKGLLPEPVYYLLDQSLLSDPVQAMEQLAVLGAAARFRLIPYRSVGVKNGMLLAFRPDSVTIDGKHKSGLLIALSPHKLCEGTGLQALAGI